MTPSAGRLDIPAWRSTYEPLPRADTLIVHATILDGAGGRHDDCDLLIRDGRIAALGRELRGADDAEVADVAGAWVTPGIIDPHCHAGDFPAPYIAQELAFSDVNEDTSPNTAQVRAEHSISVQDPTFVRALEGGVTTLHVLPGSINLFAGLTVTLKTTLATTVQAMKVPQARPGLKLAYGENPKRFYGAKGRFPSSRMGSVAGLREAWIKAQAYERAWRAFEAGEAGAPPERDLGLDSLAAALSGEAAVHIHAYRADDMATMIAVAREFGYRIAAFHHAVEAYKIPELFLANDVAAVVWSDWWGFKMEAFDAVRENAALMDAAGACVALHSDSWVVGERLTVEAGKAMAAGRRMGLAIAPERAIRWVTLNAAKVLGLDDRIGSLETGKNADLVVWSGDPFSIYSKAERVFIDGALVFDRGARRPIGDLELGHPSLGLRP